MRANRRLAPSDGGRRGEMARSDGGAAPASLTMLKIPRLIKILKQPRLPRHPSQRFLSPRTRRRIIDRDKPRQIAQLRRRLPRGQNLHRHPYPSTDPLGNGPERKPLFRHAVIPRASRALFQRQPRQPRRIQPMHSRPAIGSCTDIGRVAALFGAGGELWDETGILRPVDGRRQADDRRGP